MYTPHPLADDATNLLVIIEAMISCLPLENRRCVQNKLELEIKQRITSGVDILNAKRIQDMAAAAGLKLQISS